MHIVYHNTWKIAREKSNKHEKILDDSVENTSVWAGVPCEK